jgi:hypothetical protein
VFGVLSVVLYKPWRSQIDRRRARLSPIEALEERGIGSPSFDRGSSGNEIEVAREVEGHSVQRIEVDACGKR